VRVRASEVKRITRQSGHSSQNQATRWEQPRPVRRIRRRDEVEKPQTTPHQQKECQVFPRDDLDEKLSGGTGNYARILDGIRIIVRGG
jgi:hypothetical protein